MTKRRVIRVLPFLHPAHRPPEVEFEPHFRENLPLWSSRRHPEGSPVPSLEQLNKLLSAEPNDIFLNFAKAMELAKTQQFADAFAQFDRVITLDPGYAPAFFQKGRAQLQAGDVDAAKATLREGVSRARAAGDHHAAGEMTELLNSL